MKKVFLYILVSFLPLCVYGQSSQPVMNPDKSVTFTFTYPNAKEVKIAGTMLEQRNIVTPIGTFAKESKVKMQRQGDSWIYTTEPLSPDLYSYRFFVDDEYIVLDQNNNNILRDIDRELNYFIIPGGVADNYITQNVHHGKISHVWYPSSIKGFAKRRMTIYTPYLYNTTKSSFPVLYLLHGSGGDEDSWITCGRVAQILDNLISQGRCKPMIVVMPNGNATLAAAPGKDPNNPDVQPSGNNISSMYGIIETSFVKDIVTYVDNNYRTLNKKEGRAIAGLSLGGLHTLYTSMNNPNTFDYIGLFSAQTTNALNNKKINNIRGMNKTWKNLKGFLPFLGKGKLDNKISSITKGAESGSINIYEDMEKKMQQQFANPPKVYYIALGKDDFTKKLNDDLRELMDRNNFKYIYNETDGAHSWNNWRRYLVDFLPLLFKK